jgi:cytochrome c biogenesis protein
LSGRMKSFFLARKTVITLLALIFCVVLAGGLVPQRIATSTADMEKWRIAHPAFFPWAERLGLFHIFSTPWFTALLALAFIVLAISCWDQFRAAWRKTFAAADGGGCDGVPVAVSTEFLSQTLRRAGYRPLTDGKNVLRFVRQPWGYWGSFLLHFGMVVTIAASLYVAMTGQRGRLNIVQGSVHMPAQPWLDEEHGVLASRLILPVPVRFDALRLQVTPGGTVDRVASDIVFLTGGGEDTRSVAINAILHYQGLHVYQSTDYGNAFTLEFIERGGTIRRERLLMPHPPAHDQAGYEDFALPWLGHELSAKYYADAERKSLVGGNPLLVLRLVDYGKELTRLSLKAGESGILGDLHVRLLKIEKWTGLIFVNVAGMSFIFFGFFIIASGAALNYMAAPREVIVKATPTGYCITWRAGRFADFYRDEYDGILKKLEEVATDG